MGETVAHQARGQAGELVTGELILGTAPWGVRSILTQTRQSPPILPVLGAAGGEKGPGTGSGGHAGTHSPCPGATAWNQAWKPRPSTLPSETKVTRRRLVLVLSVGGGSRPHTLQGAGRG